MNLTDKEADILAAVELRANLSVEQIREETGYRSHTIRYALGRLKQYGIIQPLPFVNICALGYTMHNIFFSIGSENKQLRQQVANAFVEAPEVLWVAEMGSEFQFGVGICAKRLSDVAELLRRISSKIDILFCQKAVSTQFAVTILPRRYLTSKSVRSKALQIFQPDKEHEVDQLDDKILRTLSRFGGATRPAVAKELCIPASTLDLRIKKLENKKVICGYMYCVATSAFNMQAHKLLVHAKRHSPETFKRIHAFAERNPAVVHIIECFGNWDFELGVEVHRPEQVTQVTEELYDALGSEIHSVRALTKFRDIKYLMYPAMPLHTLANVAAA